MAWITEGDMERSPQPTAATLGGPKGPIHCKDWAPFFLFFFCKTSRVSKRGLLYMHALLQQCPPSNSCKYIQAHQETARVFYRWLRLLRLPSTALQLINLINCTSTAIYSNSIFKRMCLVIIILQCQVALKK